MIPNFKAAMFDMDGTLLHSMRYWRLATVELLLAYNIIPSPDQMARVFSSSSRALCMEVFLEHGIFKDQWEILRELEVYMHRHYRQDVIMKPDADAYLLKLQKANIRMCIATAAPQEFACEVLERLNLLHYFDFVTDCYAEKMRKDDPAFFHRMAQRMNVSTNEMCVFEDALYSIESAKKAGCPVIAVRDEIQALDWPKIENLADCCIEEYRRLL